MKSSNFLRIAVLAVCMIFSILANSVYALEIRFIVGQVYVERDGKALPASMGMKVLQGDIIATRKTSIAELAYSDGSFMKVFENSRIKISQLDDKQENISVINGIVRTKIAKLQKGDSRKVYTPTTVCAVRGTEFYVAVSDGSNSRINMEDGELFLVNPYGQVEISGEEQATVSVAGNPAVDENPQAPEEWKHDDDKEFLLEPQKQAQNLDSYIKKFEERSNKQSKEISHLNKLSAQKQSPKKMEQEMNDIEVKSAMIADDYFLGDCVNEAIAGIMEIHKDKNNEIYEILRGVKDHADAVVRQQKANYDAIMAIKEAYRRNYEEIKGKHKESVDSIKEEVRKAKE